MIRFLIIGFVIAILGTGCRIGPPTVLPDRVDYISAISESWKSQMLLNMVKIRYGDVPVFVEVSSIISQYGVENGINYNFEWQYPPTLRTPGVGGSIKYQERPTITYIPLTGEKFARSLLTPIPPSAIFFLIQAGKPVDVVFYLCVQSVNGINNRYDGPMRSIPISPDFVELLTKMRRVQQSDTIGMRMQIDENKQTTLFYFKKDISPETAEDSAWIRQKLGLNPQTHEFKVVYGLVPQHENEIAILSRSMMEILVQMVSAIDVSENDIQQKRTYAVAKTNDPFAEQMHICIRSGREKPSDAFVSISYRDKWFWIEDTDFKSKQIFSSLMMLLSLTESDKGASQPLITVPTG